MTRAAAVLLLVILATAGCGASSPTAPPATPTGSGPTGSPFAPPTPDRTPSPTGCPPYREASGHWPTDRLVDMAVTAGGFGPDVLEFTFAPASRPGASATVVTRQTRPPFSQAGSGEPVDVIGSAFYEFRFEGMLLADDSGNATYRGSRDLRTGLPGIRHVVILDAFEGVLTFVIGTDGGCPWFEAAPATATIRFYAGGPTP